MLATDGAPPRATLIRNIRVFDGERCLEDDSVLVEGGVITAVGTARSAPPGATVVDGAGGTLLPGLIDSHVHALYPRNLAEALAFGVTTELDMFCVPPHLPELRDAAATRVDVADFRSAGIGATAPGGHPTQLADWGVYPTFPTVAGPHEAGEFVAARVREGADYIKVFIEDGSFWGRTRQTLSADTVYALIRAAHEADKMVLVHADSGASARLALDAGADALAHHPNDADPTSELTDQLARADRFVIPTLKMPAAFAPGRSGADGGNDDLLEHPDLGPYLDPQTRRFMTAPPPPPPKDAPAEFTQLGLDFDGVLAITAKLHRAGVALLAGTDSIPIFGHGVGLHRELALLVEAGLSPTDALAAATSLPADRFTLTDRGRIAPGLRADLLLVTGDPTTEITASRTIAGIWRAGSRLDRRSYREQLSTQG